MNILRLIVYPLRGFSYSHTRYQGLAIDINLFLHPAVSRNFAPIFMSPIVPTDVSKYECKVS